MLCNFNLSAQLRKALFSLDFVCWRTFRAVFEEREYFLVPTRDLRGWAWKFACEGCKVQGFGLSSAAGKAELRCGAFIPSYLWHQKLSSQPLARPRNNCAWNGWWALGRIYFPLKIPFFPLLCAAFFVYYRPQWQWQIQYHRFPAFCLWLSSPKNPLQKALGADPQFWRAQGHPELLCGSSLPKNHWQGMYEPRFFSFQQLKNLLIFAYFCWSWGKLGSVISLPLGYKPSVLINFKNPLLSSAALKILVRILLFAAGLICGGLLVENNLEIFNHCFKKNSF